MNSRIPFCVGQIVFLTLAVRARWWLSTLFRRSALFDTLISTPSMQKTMNRFCIAVFVAAGFLTLFCLSDAKAEPASNDLPEALRACIDEPDDALRLACYDREIACRSSTRSIRQVSPSCISVWNR